MLRQDFSQLIPEQHHMNYTLALFFAFLVCAILPASLSAQSDPDLPRFKTSKKSLFDIADDQKHTFGYLEVPENRADPKSNTIELPVYFFKSRSKTPANDPIIWLTGGPGGSLMVSAKYTKYYRYLDDRDLILVEQRGTRYAKPHLSCPEWGKAMHKATYLEYTSPNAPTINNAYEKLLIDAAAECRDRLKSKQIDLNGYTTREIAADIEDLRKVLGIDEYNLYSLSYGTKIAQVLMRDNPEPIRSVVLESPLPLEVQYDEESSKNLLETLDTILDDCAQQAACNEAFPGLKPRFYAFLEQITAEPLQLEIIPNEKKKPVTIYLRGKDVAERLSASSTADMPTLPLLISEILAGDYDRLGSFFLQSPPGDGEGKGKRLSVWCAEEHPFNAQALIQEETSKYPAIRGLTPATYSNEICSTWNVEPEPTTENNPIQSDIPTLILNGQYDNITPPSWGQALKQNLSNSYHLIFDGFHHDITTYWDNPCGMQVANAFFNNPMIEPRLSCFEELSSFQFEIGND